MTDELKQKLRNDFENMEINKLQETVNYYNRRVDRCVYVTETARIANEVFLERNNTNK